MALRRVAIVTGAAQGIGKAIALRLARDNYHIALSDLPSKSEKLQDVRKEIVALGGRRVSVVHSDVSQDGDVKMLVDAAVNDLGSVDVMVANAGICPTGSILDTSVDDWDRIFSVNARGVFLCYKHAAIQMIKQGRGGRIIGASSAAGKQGIGLIGTYSATKFSVRGLTQAAAQEFGPHGITVNAYAPGIIETSMVRDSLTALVPGGDVTQLLTGTMSTIGEPDDVAGLVAYLAKEEARFITGQTVSINGGMHFD